MELLALIVEFIKVLLIFNVRDEFAANSMKTFVPFTFIINVQFLMVTLLLVYWNSDQVPVVLIGYKLMVIL